MPQKRKAQQRRYSPAHISQNRVGRRKTTRTRRTSYSARPHSGNQKQSSFNWANIRALQESALLQRLNERLEPFQETLSQELVEINTPKGPLSITRRSALIGAGLLGLAGLVAQGVNTLTNKQSGSTPPNRLTVTQDQVFSRDACEAVPLDNYLRLSRSFDMPVGTLIYSNSDTIACALVPSKSAHPLVSIQSIQLTTGNIKELLRTALNHDEGFDILDARISDEVLVWIEYNMLSSAWKLYATDLNNDIASGAELLDEADITWEIPSIAAVGKRVFWQVMRRVRADSKGDDPLQVYEQEQLQKAKNGVDSTPQKGLPNTASSASDDLIRSFNAQDSNANSKEQSSLPDNYIKSVRVGSGDSAHIALKSQARFTTQLYACDRGVVCTPNVEDFKKSVQLSLLSSEDAALIAQLPLPSGMKPLDAGWGLTGFFFSFNTIYNFGDGISNLGTYVPVREQLAENFGAGDQADEANKDAALYSKLPWFKYDASPSGNACWCGNSFIIKGRSVLAGIRLLEKGIFSSEIQNDSSLWGEYLASTGSRKRIISFTEINNKEDARKSVCKVAIYEANTSTE